MRAGQRGFTLVELVVVLGILSIAVAMGIPSFIQWRKNLELRDAASEISAVLMQARTKAIIDRLNYSITFDGTTNGYSTVKWLAGAASAAGGTVTGRVGSTWRSVDIYDDTSDPACPPFTGGDVVFRPNSTADASGTSGSEAVYLRDTAVTQRYRVKVIGVTGRITVERWMGDTWASAS